MYLKAFYLLLALFICLTGSACAQCEFGAYLGGDGAPSKEQILQFEDMTGRHLSSVLWYEGFGSFTFPAFNFSHVNDNIRFHDGYNTQTSLHITMEPWVNLNNLNAGAYDTYLKQYACWLKDYGTEVRFRFGHEMIQDDNPATAGWYPWQDSPEQYVEAFRHVVSVFREAGADNVRFVWNPNSPNTDLEILKKYFPGAEYVDWLGMDGYNWTSPDTTFDDTFGPLYQLLINNTDFFGDKPIMIGEFSSGDSTLKPEWILDAFSSIEDEYTKIRAIYWFNVLKERDWRVNSTPEALAAFRQALQPAYFTSHTSAGEPEMAPCTMRVAATLPKVSTLNVAVTKIEGSSWHNGQSSVDFGLLTLDSAYSIFRASCYYAIDVGIVSNEPSWTVTHSVTSVTNGVDSLDENIDVIFMKQNARDGSELKKTTYAASNGVTYARSAFNEGDWLRVYYGISDGSAGSPGKPVTLSKQPGTYAGTVRFTLTP